MKYFILILTVLFSSFTAASEPKYYIQEHLDSPPVLIGGKRAARGEQRLLFTYYRHTGTYYQGWKNVDATIGPLTFAEGEFPETELDHVLVADMTARFLHKRFNYVLDGINDIWESRYDDMVAGSFEGDCTIYSWTAVETLMRAGIPASAIFIATGTEWLKAVTNQQYHRNHPEADRPGHMFVMIWARGGYYVIDNAHQRLQKAEDYFGEDVYPHSIIHMKNWTADKDRNFGLPWGRFWFPID